MRNGGYHLPDWDPEATDDHEVKADSTDTGHGALTDKMKDGTHITRSVVTEGGAKKVQLDVAWPTVATTVPGADIDGGNIGSGTDYHPKGHRHELNISPTTVPLANGVASVGSGKTYADILHTHPIDDPAVVGSRLYPVAVPNTLLRDAVRCILQYGGEGGGGAYNWLVRFTQIAGVSTWQATSVGKIYGRDSDGNGTIELLEGDRFLVYQGGGSFEAKYFWIYEVVTAGADGNKAVIRRTWDANTPETLCPGAVVQVTGVGAYGEGNYYTISNADAIEMDVDAITCTSSADPPGGTVYNLVTLAQRNAMAVSDGVLVYQTTWTGPGEVTIGNSHVTLAGTPGVTAFPAGTYTFAIERAYLDEVPVGTTTTITAYLRDADGELAVIAQGESVPLTNISTALTFQDIAAADLPGGADHKMLLTYLLSTDATVPITVNLIYSSPTLGTYVETPMVLAATGTTDHQVLANRDQDVGAGEDACHPWSALGGEGRPHPGVGTATIDDGIVTLSNCYTSEVTLGSGGTINGIKDDGWLRGDGHRLVVYGASNAAPVELVNNVAVGAGNLPFYLPYSAGTDANGRLPKIRIKGSPSFVSLYIDPGIGVYLTGPVNT